MELDSCTEIIITSALIGHSICMLLNKPDVNCVKIVINFLFT
jgi:hypothetical protein